MENLGKIRMVNKVKIRMKRRKISTRLFQIVIVTVVMTLFVYLIFTAGLQRASTPTDTFSWLSTRNLSVFLRPEEATRLASPQPSPCQEGVQSAPIRLLVAVFSAPQNTAARAVIRKTWAHKFKDYPGVATIFMLGQALDLEVHKRVLSESQEHNDLVVEDFHDVYLNLTMKTGFLLKWLNQDCPRAKFVLKVDDDVFVNTDQVWSTLESSHLYSTSMAVEGKDGALVNTNLDYAIIGHVMHTVPIRDPSSKWFLPIEFYPLNIFPAFTSGTAYIFTGSLVPSLLHCTLKTPFINLEDVFLTGLCATTQLGLRLTHNPSFVWRPMTVGGSHTCYFKQSVTVHGSSPEHMEEVWARTQDHHLCDSILFSAMTAVSRVIEFVRNIFRI